MDCGLSRTFLNPKQQPKQLTRRTCRNSPGPLQLAWIAHSQNLPQHQKATGSNELNEARKACAGRRACAPSWGPKDASFEQWLPPEAFYPADERMSHGYKYLCLQGYQIEPKSACNFFNKAPFKCQGTNRNPLGKTGIVFCHPRPKGRNLRLLVKIQFSTLSLKLPLMTCASAADMDVKIKSSLVATIPHLQCQECAKTGQRLKTS